MTCVVNKRGHVATVNDVYIGRPSIWGNPFKIGPDGTREEVIAKYETYITKKLMKRDKIYWDALVALEGKTLVCWCKPQACHGDVLVKLIEECVS